MDPKGPGSATAHRAEPNTTTRNADDERFRTIFEHAPDAILVLDLDTGFFVEANQHACDLLGYSAPEFRGLTPGDISVDPQPSGRPAVEAATEVIAEAAAGGQPAFEWTLKDRSGAGIEVEVRLIRMPPFERTLVLGTMTDIRIRKSAEREVARRERRFRTLSDNSPDWIVRLDRQLRRVYVNPAVALASQSRVEELIGRRPTESFPDSSEMKAWEEGAKRCFETGEPQVLEREADVAGQRVLQTSIVPEFDDDGEIETVLSVTRDVTSVRRAVEAEVRLAGIVESANDAILSSDMDGVITSWNPGAERLFGYSAAEVVGKSTEFLFARALSERADIRRRVLAGETISGHVREWRTRDGRPVVASTTFFPLRDASGAVTGMASIASDLTDERAAMRALARSEERLRLALETARMGSWTWFAQEDRMEYTAQAAAIYQRALDAMPKTMRESLALLHPDEAPRALEGLGSGIPPGANREYRILLPDGSYRWIESLGDLVQIEDGVVSGIIVDVHERKVARDALRESEERLRQIVESVSAGIWVFDGTNVLMVNGALERMTGYGREQLLQPLFFDTFISPDQTALMRERAAARLRGEPAPPNYEISVSAKDGSVRVWELAASTITFRGIPASIVSAFDVTDRRLSEEALRESESRFRSVVNSAAVGIIIFDGENVVEANPAAGAIFGVDAARLTEPGFMSSLTDADTGAAIRARGQARLRGEEVAPTFEARGRHSSGRTVYLHLNANTIELGGKLASLVSIVDLTDRRAAEDALRLSESRFRSLVDNSPDFITRIGRDLRHEFVNRTAELEAGLDPSRVIGKRGDELGYPPEIGALWVARHSQVIETGESLEFEYAMPGPSAPEESVYRRARLIPETGDDGEVHHVLSIVTDITAERTAEAERRRLDQQMQHAQKLESLGVLAGGIAHDFNNLLVAILGNAGLALMELPPESPARQTLLSIETAAQRAAELTRQMLAYSGKGRFIIEPLNLSKVVEEMAHLLEVSVSKRAVLKYRFAPQLPIVEGDATQLRQVIMNLIINASDAIGDRSGVISITTGMLYADHAYLSEAYLDGNLPEGDYVYLEVADTGVGMDVETRARIFDPFFTTKFTGRGLGLAAVLGIVRGHRGAIKLYSEPGRGTTFKVLFPTAAPTVSPAGSDEPASPASSGAGRTILVVDDDETVRTVTRRILEHSGVSVLLAADGVEGLRAYSENPGIDLVLLDMTMPRMDGEETFRELRRFDPDVRVVLTSGYNEQDATERFVGKGLAGFIQKPYRPAELMAKIDSALA